MGKWIEDIKGLMQPGITVMAAILLVGLASKNYDPDKIFAVAVGVLLFWFGYTGLKNFNYIGGNGKPNGAVPNSGTQIPNPGTTTTSNGNVTVDAPVVPEPPYIEPVGEKFNTEAFLKTVDINTPNVYGEVNPSTTFYEAQAVLNSKVWATANDYKQGVVVVKELARAAFRYIWGLPDTATDPLAYAKEHLNDNLGCTTCGPRTCTYPDLRFKALQLGTGYYSSYLDLVGMEKQ